METLSCSHIQNLGVALVREYLYRKGLQNTLECMDRECPCTPDSIRSRVVLARMLCIEKLLQRNREQVNPYKTMLEVVVLYLQEKLAISKSKRVLKHKRRILQKEGKSRPIKEDLPIEPPYRTPLKGKFCTVVDLKLHELKALKLHSSLGQKGDAKICYDYDDDSSSSESLQEQESKRSKGRPWR